MKLGAVILPATTALGPQDLGDRLSRGGVRHVITNAETDKFADVPGDCGRIAVVMRLRRGAFTGTLTPSTRRHHSLPPPPDDPMLVYFTLRPHEPPKARRAHTTGPIRSATLSTMYFIGLSRATSISTSAPGLGKHAWSSFFAPWIAESTIVAYNYARFDPARFLGVLQHVAVTSLCALRRCGAC